MSIFEGWKEGFKLDWFDNFKSTFSGFQEKYAPILGDPELKSFLIISILALIALLVTFIVLIKVKKVKLDSRTMTRIGLAIGLACVLQVFRIYRFPYGGSVTLGSMIPIFVIAFIIWIHLLSIKLV